MQMYKDRVLRMPACFVQRNGTEIQKALNRDTVC